MKPILHCLIYPKQGAFIKDRSITNNVMITLEFMHDLHWAPIHHDLMTIKLDMEWAYNRMCWAFLERAS